eukprot:1155361-Pleurochrysis_carterae.AAC.1
MWMTLAVTNAVTRTALAMREIIGHGKVDAPLEGRGSCDASSGLACSSTCRAFATALDERRDRDERDWSEVYSVSDGCGFASTV